MIRTSEVVIESVSAALGAGEGLFELAKRAVDGVGEVGAVIAATFSNPERFPALSVKVAAELKLPTSTPAFDLQLACSAYPYALYLAGKLAADLGRRVLVVDGDVQSRLVDTADHDTGSIFSDAVTATVVSASTTGESSWDFMSRFDEALTCGESGPIRMDGMKVFSFVALEVSKFLRAFGGDFDMFVPHQANPYMIRQLAKTLSLSDKLLTIDDTVKNPGSASIPLTLAAHGKPGRALIAGFGAGYSASAGIVRLAEGFVSKAPRPELNARSESKRA